MKKALQNAFASCRAFSRAGIFATVPFRGEFEAFSHENPNRHNGKKMNISPYSTQMQPLWQLFEGGGHLTKEYLHEIGQEMLYIGTLLCADKEGENAIDLEAVTPVLNRLSWRFRLDQSARRDLIDIGGGPIDGVSDWSVYDPVAVSIHHLLDHQAVESKTWGEAMMMILQTLHRQKDGSVLRQFYERRIFGGRRLSKNPSDFAQSELIADGIYMNLNMPGGSARGMLGFIAARYKMCIYDFHICAQFNSKKAARNRKKK